MYYWRIFDYKGRFVGEYDTWHDFIEAFNNCGIGYSYKIYYK